MGLDERKAEDMVGVGAVSVKLSRGKGLLLGLLGQGLVVRVVRKATPTALQYSEIIQCQRLCCGVWMAPHYGVAFQTSAHSPVASLKLESHR